MSELPVSFNDERRGFFVYHGNVLGFGGYIRRPECRSLGTHAVAIVPPSGGESYSRVKNFNYKGIVTFDEASAYATGNESDDAYNMLATVTIKNFNYFGYIHADLIVARVSSVHKKLTPEEIADKSREDVLNEARLSLQGTMMQGLTVGGKDHNIGFDTSRFDRCERYEHIVEAFPKGCHKYKGDSDKLPSVVRTSLAANASAVIEHDFGDVFGKIYVGELIVQRGHVRINMLRFELGSPVDGGGSAGSGEGNGTEMPPPP
jgi:hypothetical protein